MKTQYIAFISVIIGSLTTLFGSLLSHWLTMRREQRQWERQQQANQIKIQRQKKEESYNNAMRHLLRSRNKRSMLTASGETVLEKQYIKEWIDELTESQLALSNLIIVADATYHPQLNQSLASIRQAICELLRIPVSDPQMESLSSGLYGEGLPERKHFSEISNLLPTLDAAYATVSSCAAEDLKND